MNSDQDNSEEPEDIPKHRGHNRVRISRKQLMYNNFLGGIAWGLGTAIGATVVVALLLFAINKLDTVPLIGDFINTIIDEIQSNQGIQ